MAKRKQATEAATEQENGQPGGETVSGYLIVRLGPDEGDEALWEPHVKTFDITGRPMKGSVRVEPEGVEGDDQLSGWIRRAVKFVGKLPAKGK